ncbi:MAG TPA: hypothetical protein VIA82_03080 [Candidatus Limnocylindria bacterium]
MSTMLRRVTALIAIAGLTVACSGGNGGNGTQTVTATEKEWAITLANSNFTAGKITINVTNDGDKEHEFVIRKTDLQSDALPTNADGEVVEDDPQLSEVGDPSEIETVPAGSSDKSITLDLQPGHYVIFCNIHDEDLLHYQKGMHTDFTVS